MALGLTSNDIAILAQYAKRGERLAYWNYLNTAAGGANAYATLAGQVVQNNTFDGVVANR